MEQVFVECLIFMHELHLKCTSCLDNLHLQICKLASDFCKHVSDVNKPGMCMSMLYEASVHVLTLSEPC